MKLDLERLQTLRAGELARFKARTPRSNALYAESRGLMPNGVPCSWMAAFYPGTEIFVDRGNGATFTDVDGNRYLDMTQCDLSMVCGFGPPAIARAVAERFANGSHFLLPTEDAIAVARLLRARFGMAAWQFTLSASAANTEAFRIARRATGKDKVLIFSGKYHGHIDETLVHNVGGASQPDHHGLPRGVEQRTVEVPFNDLDAVERALKGGDVACVLAEPAMTNIGVIHPDDGFHVALHEFAHLLDVQDSLFDGVPTGVEGEALRTWLAVQQRELQRLQRGKSLLDPYGGESAAEFLAVAVETFFEPALAMRARHHELYELLRAYFGQDPAAWDEARGL